MVVLLEFKEEEEDLVKEEARPSAIIVDNQDTMLEIIQILHRCSHVVRHWITLSRNVHRLLLNVKPRLMGIRTNSSI